MSKCVASIKCVAFIQPVKICCFLQRIISDCDIFCADSGEDDAGKDDQSDEEWVMSDWSDAGKDDHSDEEWVLSDWSDAGL